MPFVFYDTETTGTSSAFDQVLQFAAIRTDDDLNELDRFEIRSRILPHIVPSPGAMKVTGITADQLDDPALPSHYEMVCSIYNLLLAWSPAIFIGHNTLGFDEAMMRQAFYQTLHPVYLTNTHGNGRNDTLPLLRAASLKYPGSISVPEGPDGKKIFKLDRLAPENGFPHLNAHDALADVEATIFLAKLLRERTPDIWHRAIKFSHKRNVQEHIEGEKILATTEFYFGKAYTFHVTKIGSNPKNGAEQLAFDLSRDPEPLIALCDQDLKKALQASPKVIRSLKANAAPVIWPKDDSPSDTETGSLTLNELERRCDHLRSSPENCGRLVRLYLEGRDPFPPKDNVEEQIFDGFPTRNDQNAMSRFHEMPWHDRTAILDTISDRRFRDLGQRLIYSEAPHLLTEEQRTNYDRALAKRLMTPDDVAPWLTFNKAIVEGEDLLATSDSSSKDLLSGHLERLRIHRDRASRLWL